MCLVRTVSAIEVLRGIQIADHSEENWRRCHHQCAGVHWHIGLLAMDHMGMGLKDAAVAEELLTMWVNVVTIVTPINK